LSEPRIWEPVASFVQVDGGTLWIDTNSPASRPQKFYLVTP